MQSSDFSKWNNYEIGNVSWINDRVNHAHRHVFINYVINSKHINSVLEIGPGELIECQSICSMRDVNYTIVDVSDTFLDNCKSKLPKVNTIKCNMEHFNDVDVNQFDVAYVAAVLEHSCNIKLAIRNILVASKEFHFVLFKWKFRGGMKINYNKNKAYYSTFFNIFNLIKIIKRYADIRYADVISEDGSMRLPLDVYYKKCKDEKFSNIFPVLVAKKRSNKELQHRNTNYLIIQGQSKNHQWTKGHELRYWNTNGLEKGKHIYAQYCKAFAFDDYNFTGKRIVDVGCGPFGGCFCDMPEFNVIPVDILADEYKSMSVSARPIVFGDLSKKLLFADKSFDFVVCTNVIDHIPNLQHGFNELYRILDAGGIAFIHVHLRTKEHLNKAHIHVVDLQRINTLASKSDFIVIRNQEDTDWVNDRDDRKAAYAILQK